MEQSKFEREMNTLVSSFLTGLGVPSTEVSGIFLARMVRCMAVSYHKYGKVAEAYPDKFDAIADIRTRVGKYREHGDFWMLVDAANFAMIEVMHPNANRARINNPEPHWGRNEDDTSPGRNDAVTHRLKQEDNKGGAIGGDGFIHIPETY